MVGLIDWSLLPVQLFHDFCHFSDISFIARGSSSEAGDYSAVTVRERLSFAAESAFSFPGMPTWLGIQHKAMVFLACLNWVFYNKFIRRDSKNSGCCIVQLRITAYAKTISIWGEYSVTMSQPGVADAKWVDHYSIIAAIRSHIKHETQLSLTNRATHLCKRNGVADLLKTRPSHVLPCRIGSFCAKGCRHKCVRIPKIGERRDPARLMWGVADPPKQVSYPYVLPRQIWYSCDNGCMHK